MPTTNKGPSKEIVELVLVFKVRDPTGRSECSPTDEFSLVRGRNTIPYDRDLTRDFMESSAFFSRMDLRSAHTPPYRVSLYIMYCRFETMRVSRRTELVGSETGGVVVEKNAINDGVLLSEVVDKSIRVSQ